LALEELKEKKKAITLPTGVAFVTFKRLESAQKVYRDHVRHCWMYRYEIFSLTEFLSERSINLSKRF
jgi:hypothetical protein